MVLDTKLLLVPAAGATRCFLCGWLAARASLLLGSQARPGAGLLTARPAALGMALAGCCVLWHGLRVGLSRLRGLASDRAVDAALAGAGVGMALARWAPDLASAQTELHGSAVLSALQTLGGRRAAPPRAAELRDHVGAIVAVEPRGRRHSIANRLGAVCLDAVAPTALACAASWWLLTAAPTTLPRGAQRWLGSLSSSPQQGAAAAAAVAAAAATATAATAATAAAAVSSAAAAASWRSLAEAARLGWLRGARAHLCGAAPAALLMQHRALRRYLKP